MSGLFHCMFISCRDRALDGGHVRSVLRRDGRDHGCAVRPPAEPQRAAAKVRHHGVAQVRFRPIVYSALPSPVSTCIHDFVASTGSGKCCDSFTLVTGSRALHLPGQALAHIHAQHRPQLLPDRWCLRHRSHPGTTAHTLAVDVAGEQLQVSFLPHEQSLWIMLYTCLLGKRKAIENPRVDTNLNLLLPPPAIALDHLLDLLGGGQSSSGTILAARLGIFCPVRSRAAGDNRCQQHLAAL